MSEDTYLVMAGIGEYEDYYEDYTERPYKFYRTKSEAISDINKINKSLSEVYNLCEFLQEDRESLMIKVELHQPYKVDLTSLKRDSNG